MKPTRLLLLALAVLLMPSSANAQVGTNTALANPNIASAAELAALPHVDEQLAAAMIEARPFLTMGSLDELLGASLETAQREELYRHLWVPINLNDVTEAEILLIPGVGDRMAHEFEEYHPYAALAQFRREIGKYVDDDELARLEQYVFVPLDLNSASEADFLTIPGVGNRMVHEFLEYRPYVGMEQFRREMGKYVDADVVARFERYMIIE